MAFNETLSNRVREELADVTRVEEKLMFGGICFMVNDKMCIGIVGDEMMCRIGPQAYEQAVEKNGVREMIFTGRPMVGYVFVDQHVLSSKKDLRYWVDLCLKFNEHAKSSKKKAKKK
jgi:TfoX/Sxy family transcriptional regulator of competence genes